MANLSPALKRCSTPAVLEDHTRYLITTGCKASNISPTSALARTSLLLCIVFCQASGLLQCVLFLMAWAVGLCLAI
jgi:hypothetical protein